ncbi:hypothetical protein [Amycolatopsis sp.]|uniref:hypothetical protein n=1 Tax=Amycolatopsis sp. TaxID=37632 RepID=UPI002CD981DD|nr:hypothetical protein [Amycolatopsis sp.]HVV14478.1 hypothetical protein [Amycolatopsis sp.]
MPSRRLLTAGLTLTMLCLTATPAEAADPVLVPSCSATVTEQPGRQVVLDPAGVTGPIRQALTKLDPLGLLTGQFDTDWAAAGPIPLGTVPEGQAEISGATIADAVTARLGEIPLLGPVLQPLVATVHGTLASLCGILLRGTAPAAAPPASTPGSAPQPGSPTSPGASPSSSSSSARLPDSTASGASGPTVFGSLVPGGALFPLTGSGVPGNGAALDRLQPAALASAPQPAGSAEVLPTRHDALSTSTLTALLLLSVVSALLVRRWVLGGRG